MERGDLKIHKIHSLWPEKRGFYLHKEREEEEYIFVHFLSPVHLRIGDAEYEESVGSCVLYDRFSDRTIEAAEVPLLHSWFHAEGDFPSLLKKYGLHFNTIYRPGCEAELTELMQTLELEMLQKKSCYREICVLRIEELFARISRGVREGAKGRLAPETEQKMLKLRAFLQQHYAEIESVSVLAETVHMSRARFFAAYREMFGISPGQDLQRIRMEHAKQLLMTRRYAVLEVAEAVGYRNQYHFIRAFREHTGSTPGKYRG